MSQVFSLHTSFTCPNHISVVVPGAVLGSHIHIIDITKRRRIFCFCFHTVQLTAMCRCSAPGAQCMNELALMRVCTRALVNQTTQAELLYHLKCYTFQQWPSLFSAVRHPIMNMHARICLLICSDPCE